MPWNHRTTRRDRKRRNTDRCRGLNRVHVVHYDDTVLVPEFLARRAIRWPVRCVICKRIIHHSPIFSFAESLLGGIFVAGKPARAGVKLWWDPTTGGNIPIQLPNAPVTHLILRVQAPPQRGTIAISGYPEA